MANLYIYLCGAGILILLNMERQRQAEVVTAGIFLLALFSIYDAKNYVRTGVLAVLIFLCLTIAKTTEAFWNHPVEKVVKTMDRYSFAFYVGHTTVYFACSELIASTTVNKYLISIAGVLVSVLLSIMIQKVSQTEAQMIMRNGAIGRKN